MYCPHCGHHLPKVLRDGISSCPNCRRIFDSCRFNQILSLSWAVRKEHIDNSEHLINYFGASEKDARFLVDHVYDDCLSHEEFFKFLLEFKATNYCELSLDSVS